MTRVIRESFLRSKGQRSRSPSRLTPWPKISHIFGTGRSMNFKLGIRWSTMTCIIHMRDDLKGQSSRSYKVIRSCCQSDACLPQLDNEKSQKHQNWQVGNFILFFPFVIFFCRPTSYTALLSHTSHCWWDNGQIHVSDMFAQQKTWYFHFRAHIWNSDRIAWRCVVIHAEHVVHSAWILFWLWMYVCLYVCMLGL